MRPPMPGAPGPMPGQQPMGGPGCGGCVMDQSPKMCPAICMRWNTIIKPNGQVENMPASITPLAPNERVDANGVFPPMTQMMGPMQQPGVMSPSMPQPYMQGRPPMGPPTADTTTADPKPT